MKIALLAAAVLLAPAFSSAGEKYVVRNGRAVSGGHSGGGSGGGVAAGAAKSGMSAGGGSVSGAPVYSDPGVQAFVGAARRATGGHRSFYGGTRNFGRAYRVPQRVAAGESSGGSSGSGSGEGGGEGSEAPQDAPGYFKYGAKIITEGQKYQFTAPAGGERQNVVSAGEVALDPRRAHDSNRSHGLRVGAPDKLPPCTPGSNGCGGGAGGNSITANVPSSGGGSTTVINNGAHDNQNGNNGGNSNGNGNGFGGGTGFDPSF